MQVSSSSAQWQMGGGREEQRGRRYEKVRLSARLVNKVGDKRLLLILIRIAALTYAIVQLASQKDIQYTTYPVDLILASSLYTGFKVVHPLGWYRSNMSRTILIGLDLGAALSLVALTRGIHSPFMPYIYISVITAAFLLSRRGTAIVSLICAVNLILLILYVPVPDGMQTSKYLNLTGIYLLLLGVLPVLPYTINTIVKQRLRAAAIVDERRRLEHEIHDLCQSVYGLRWEMQMLNGTARSREGMAETLSHFLVLVEEIEKEARGSMELLHAVNNNQPLLSQVQDYLRLLENNSGLASRLIADGEPVIDDLIKVETLSICMEVLRNVAKHSGARMAQVTLRQKNGRLRVEVSDDGDGYNPRFPSNRGLSIMKERAESVGGQLRVISTPGSGTRVLLEMPRRCPSV